MRPQGWLRQDQSRDAPLPPARRQDRLAHPGNIETRPRCLCLQDLSPRSPRRSGKTVPQLSSRPTTSPNAASSAATSSAPLSGTAIGDLVRRPRTFQTIQDRRPALRNADRSPETLNRHQRRTRRTRSPTCRTRASTLGASTARGSANSTSSVPTHPADQTRRQQKMTAHSRSCRRSRPDRPPKPRQTDPHRISSCGVRGPRRTEGVRSGAGSPRRSSLPFGVSGRRSKTTTQTAPCSPEGSDECPRSTEASATSPAAATT